MKQLLKISAGGLVLFLALAMVEEREYFISTWFISSESQEASARDTATLSVEDRRAAIKTLQSTLQLMRHLYQSGGDERFAERMPASPGFLAELMADIEYLGRNHRIQDPELIELELGELKALDEDRVEIRTREAWRVKVLWAVTMEESEPSQVHRTRTKYFLRRGSRGWTVEGWAIDREEFESL
jgi:hypothetical protein